MLKKKALKKILITSLTLLMLICFYLIPGEEDDLSKNMKIEYVSGMGNNNIYLLNDDNYLVTKSILLTEKNKKDQALKVIDELTCKNKKTDNKLKCIIPQKTKVIELDIIDNEVTINFSKELLNIQNDLQTRLIESIVYSLTEINGINSVKINVENKQLETYPNSKEKLENPLTRSIGINKKYNISNRNNINKVVIYYIEKIDDVNHYVPVTKYLNDDREKIKIIVDELASSYIYEPNLMSFLNNKTELLSYNIDEGVLFLDFNDKLYNSNNKILEEVIYTLGYSVFENYDVKSFVVSVNGDKKQTITEENLSKRILNNK